MAPHVGLLGDFSHPQSVPSHIARLPERIGATGPVVDLAQFDVPAGDIDGLDALVWVHRPGDRYGGATAALRAASDKGVPTVAWCPVRPGPSDAFPDSFLDADHVAVVTSEHDQAWKLDVDTELHLLPPAIADTDAGVGTYRDNLPNGAVIVGAEHDPELVAQIRAELPGVVVWPSQRWLGGRFAAHVAATAHSVIVVDDHGPGRWSPYLPLLLAAGGRVIAAQDDKLEDAFDADIGTYRDVADIVELVETAEAHPDTDADRQRRVDAVLDGGHTHLARLVDLLAAVT